MPSRAAGQGEMDRRLEAGAATASDGNELWSLIGSAPVRSAHLSMRYGPPAMKCSRTWTAERALVYTAAYWIWPV